MILLFIISVLAFLFSLGYLLTFLIKKLRKKDNPFSKILFFSTFLGSFILFAISIQFDTVSGTKYNEQVKLNENLQLQIETLNGKVKYSQDEMTLVLEENQNFKAEEYKITEKYEADMKILQDEQSTLNEQISTLQKEKEDLSAKLAITQKASETVASNNQSSNSSENSNTQSAPPTTTSQNVYYKNCTQVRAAGADPIRRGEPGYAKHLDRDGDGIGCE